MRREHDGRKLAVDALLGAVAGAAAVWVMDRVDGFNFEHEDPEARKRTRSVRPGGMDPAHVAANKAAEALGYDLEPKDNNAAGLAIHYSLGVMPGALYGALRHKMPGLDAGRGTVFGLGLFFLQDEGLNALTGLSARPNDYPWQAHARGFIAHAVYGLTLDTILNLADGLRGADEPDYRPDPSTTRSADEHRYPLTQ